MRYNALLDTLQNLINYSPSQKELGEKLGLAQTSISGRANRNSNFTDEEIEKLEKAYNISIISKEPSSDEEIKERIKKLQQKVRDDVIGINERFKAGKELINLSVRSDVTASMGYGVEVLDEQQTGTYSFSKKLLRDIGADPNYSDVIVAVISDNPKYKTFEVDLSKELDYDFAVIGEVKWWSRVAR